MALFNKKVFGIYLCALIVAITAALPATEDNRVGGGGGGSISRNAISSDNDLMDSIYSDCLNKDSVSCVKYKLFSFVDKMIVQKDTFALTEGVTVIKTPGTGGGAGETDGAPRAFSGDESIESLVFQRIGKFLQTHTIKVDLKGADIVSAVTSTGRALENVSDNIFGGDSDDGVGNNSNDIVEGRGKKKKAAKILGPLLLAVGLKAAALLPLLLGGIALLAGKALLIGKIALVLSAIIGLKKLLSHEKHVTYEVVAHPHHSSSHSASHSDAYVGHSAGGYGDIGSSGGSSGGYGSSGHGGGGWGRSIDAQDLAYTGQKPQ